MKRSYQAAGLFAALSLGLAAAVFAHPGQAGGGMGMHGNAGMHQGMGMRAEGQQLMTFEERRALMEKMRNAKTPEERQKLAAENRAEMEKRAKEKGITLPEHRGPRAGLGAGRP